MTCGGLLLAAGRSSRMVASHKLLESWQGKPLVAHAADALLKAGLPVIVVTGHEAAAVKAALAGRPLQFLHADDYTQGISHSLRAGLKAAPASWQAVLIALADMPLLEPELLARLAATEGVAIPIFKGKRGNPVRWPRAHWPQLMTLTGDNGAKQLLSSLDVKEVPAFSSSIHTDIDTAEALEALRQQ